MVRRRKAWNGKAPKTEEEARRLLLQVTCDCIERFGFSKVGLSDVASAAGVTRQTVYRYFADADDLFNTAAVFASGGFLERLRKRVLRREGLAERIVETLVVSIREIPKDEHLSALVRSGDPFAVVPALEGAFAQEEMLAISDGRASLGERDRDELAELLLRLLRSYLEEPGPERSEKELRAVLYRWLIPMVEARLVLPK